MILVNIKRTTTLPTGEEKKIREAYLSSKETCSEATIHVMNTIGEDIEVISTKKAKFMDIIENTESDGFFTARVSMLILDGEKEKTKNVAILVSGKDFRDAFNTLHKYLSSYDARIISMAQTKIVEYIKQ